MLNCPCAGYDREETTKKYIDSTPLIGRGDEVDCRGRTRAFHVKCFIALGDGCEDEEDGEAVRHCRQIWKEIKI